MRLEKACMEFVETGGGRKRYTVQFNPVQLTFDAVRAEQEQQMEPAEEPGKKNFQIGKEKRPKPILAKRAETLQISMSVDLTVDTSLDPSKSVRETVEGLAAAARKTDLKEVVFQWGTLHVSGKLACASAEYTMFHADGDPSRAIVHLTIRMEDGDLYEEEYRALFRGGGS